MKRRWLWVGYLVLGLAVVLGLRPAAAFVLTTGRPSDNVSGAGLRAPGLMVGSGVARHAARLDDFQSINDITQTRRDPGLLDLFLPQAIDIVFEQINSALDLLINTLFLRAGETPPALGQLSSGTATTTTPASKRGGTDRRSLTDRSLERLERGLR